MLFEAILDWSPTAVAGIGVTGTALAPAIVMEAGAHGVMLNALFVRERPKSYGLRRLVEGPTASRDWRIAIVDDLVSSGDSALRAARTLRTLGLDVVGVATIVDFQHEALGRLQASGLPLRSLYTLSELGMGGAPTAHELRYRELWRTAGFNHAGDDVPLPRPARCADCVVVCTNNGAILGVSLAGVIEWRISFGHGVAVHTSPISIGADAVVGTDNGRLVRIEAETGTLRWEAQLADRIGGGLAGDRSGRLYVPATQLPADGRTICVDASTGAQLWSYQLPAYSHAKPVLDDAELRVFVADNAGTIAALDTESGHPTWTNSVGSAIKADLQGTSAGLIVACDFDGYVTAFDADSGDIAWRRKLGALLYSTPLCLDEGIIVGGEEHAFMLDDATGDIRWVVPMGRVQGAVRRAGSAAVSFACDDGQIRVVSIDGRVLGRQHVGVGPMSTGVVALDAETSLVATSGGELVAFRIDGHDPS